MKQYLEVLEDILTHGVKVTNRTGEKTYSVFGRQYRMNIKESIPLITTRKIFYNTAIKELLWFIRGTDSILPLHENNINIWNPWANEHASIGPLYGVQWRRWEGRHKKTYDQLREVITNLKKMPHSRRHIVSTWNVEFLPDEGLSPQDNATQGKMALAPCHLLFQFYTKPLTTYERLHYYYELCDNHELINNIDETLSMLDDELDKKGVPKYKLSCQLYIRSQDMPIGHPYNIFQYAVLTRMIAQCVNMVPDELVWVGGDCHIYENQVELVKEQLKREPKPLPYLELNPTIKEIDHFKLEHVIIHNYHPHPIIQYPISV